MSGIGKLFEWARPHKKLIYYLNEGTIEDKHLLGNKGANLCEMHRIGMPVPPAFIITAQSCLDFFRQEGGTAAGLEEHLVKDYTKAVHELEAQTGKVFGGDQKLPTGSGKHNPKEPLLLSVRSGAAASMPGMMDTVLNLGINDEIVDILARMSNNPRWAFDTYRRFLQMFGNVVLGIDKRRYEEVLEDIRAKRNVPHDSLLSMADWVEVIKRYKTIAEVPSDPWDQLRMAVQAVFNSWYSPRACKYRDIHGMTELLGTAVNVQSMVYGNMNNSSGSGVAFTRNPTTGAKEMYGEFLFNAEGEDVVSGVRTPVKLSELREMQPSLYDSLRHIESQLERHYRDMQDIEFTVENNTLYMLQTRTGKRTARAAVNIAVAMVGERLITEREALLRIDPKQMDFFTHSMIDATFANPEDPKVAECTLARGLAASSGAAVGKVVFTNEQAEESCAAHEACILVRLETSADDIGGMQAATGVLTLRGGLTSHAAVVMRGMGKPAVTGAQDLYIDPDAGTVCSRSGGSIKLGDTITIDGSTGLVYIGAMPTVSVGQDDNFRTVMDWADKYKRMRVLANAETPTDVEAADRMGAEGVGLCRTEHMFFHPSRIDLFRHMILSNTHEERASCLLKLLPMQTDDFARIFRIMGDRQITVRLLDPPLHEFLPDPYSRTFEEEIERVASRGGIPPDQCRQRVLDMQESNPMLGFRGSRLSIVHPEITEMQTKAVVAAAIQCRREGIAVSPQIMIPLVCTDHEVDIITPVILAAAESVCAAEGPPYSLEMLGIQIGSMIEVPRACIRADRIAQAAHVDFISVGSNDLTQCMFGFSRDDTSLFMSTYLDKHLIAQDPFVSIDIPGVGGMIQMAVKRAKRANPKVKVGVCGEHGGDPSSVHFFDQIGVDYVSCSPYRIPIAKVAAAQAHIKQCSDDANLPKTHIHTSFPFPYTPPWHHFQFSSY